MKGTELGVWVDEFNFSSATSEIELTFSVGEGELTNLDSEAQEFAALLAKADLKQNGYYRGADPNGFAAELQDRFGAEGALVTVLTQKSVAACVAYVLPNASDYDMTFAAPVGGIVTLNGRWGTAAGARRGLRVYDGTLNAVAAQTAVNFVTGSTTGGKAYLHVAAITGTAVGATIKVQSAPDGSTWADEGTFTVSAVGGYTLDLSGTVGKDVRLNCTSLGGATGIRCMAVVSLG